ncbi:MAG TPA: lipid A biosynthesis acyltransferase, partial [Blastocatellia bacterium]|nr:lipid A biosynthesis acyltransferase [Blastocatellia bacterium]
MLGSPVSARNRSWSRNWIEFIPAWAILTGLRILPRSFAIQVGKVVGRACYHLTRQLRDTAHRNLIIAFPDITPAARTRITKSVFTSLGRLLGEFSQFPKLSLANIGRIVEYEGFENYRRAAEQGKGVLFLTGHFGAWELCAFSH